MSETYFNEDKSVEKPRSVSCSSATGVMREIHADAREASARQAWKAAKRQNNDTLAIAIILREIDAWYEKGVTHGKAYNDKGNGPPHKNHGD